MQSARRGEVIGKAEGRQPVHFCGEDVGHHGNDPGTAQHTDGGGLIVIAGPDGKIGRAEVPGFLDLAEIPAGLLDTCDVGVLGQLRIGLRLDVDPGAGGDVVEDDGSAHGIRNDLVVPQQTLLGCLVVVGGDDQQTVHAEALRSQGVFPGYLSIVGAGTGDHRHAPRHPVHAIGDGLHALLLGHGGRLSGGTADDDGVGAAVDLPVDEPPKGGEVHRPGVKRRHNGHTRTCKENVLHNKIPPLST